MATPAEEQTWEALVKSIKDNKCVLLLGPDLASPEPGKPILELLNDYLIQQSLDDNPVKSFYNEDQFFLFDQNQELGLINLNIKSFYEQLTVPDVYHKIAEIPFHLIISVSPDHLMKSVFEEHRVDFKFDFYNKEENPGPLEKPTDKNPLLYNLFGDIDAESSMVFTYDDLFDYLTKIFGDFKLPEKLQIELNNCTSVLFMGFQMEKWYFRLLIRLLKLNKSGLKRTSKNNESKVPEIKNFFYDEFKMRFIDAGEKDIIETLHTKFDGLGLLRKSKKDAPLSDNSIYISYAWKDTKDEQREEIVDNLYQLMIEKGYNMIRDKQDLGYKGNIQNFMELIGKGAYVVVVISDKYLRSQNCMFEMLEIMNNKDVEKRIFPIVLKDAGAIYDAESSYTYLSYWEEKDKSLQEEMKKHDLGFTDEILKTLNLYKNIRQIIGFVMKMVSNLNSLSPEMLEASHFAELIAAVDKQMLEDSNKNK